MGKENKINAFFDRSIMQCVIIMHALKNEKPFLVPSNAYILYKFLASSSSLKILFIVNMYKLRMNSKLSWL